MARYRQPHVAKPVAKVDAPKESAVPEPFLNLCTIIARNYWPRTRVLAESFFRHHPAGVFTVLVIDGDQTDKHAGSERLHVLHPREIGFDEQELQQEAAAYDILELATALKPALLRHLLKSGEASAMYLDPDIEIFAPLDDLFALAAREDIVLTPHVLEPMPLDEHLPNEQTILLAGVYNLGFIAVGRGALPFLDVWADRLRRYALSDQQNGLFTDQRFIDFVPAFYRCCVCRDPSLNVAYWNVFQRRFEHGPRGYTVAGKPLRFFHYSGFDPNAPWVLSRFQGKAPRVSLAEHPALAQICAEYAAKVKAVGHDSQGRKPYGWAKLPNGVALDHRMRRMYWRALVAGEAPTPLPFSQEGAERLVAWLNERVNETQTRYQAAPEPLGDLQAVVDVHLPALTPWPRSAGNAVVGGLNFFFGDLPSASSLGRAARALLTGVLQSGEPLATYGHIPAHGPRDVPFAASVFCTTTTPAAHLTHGRYNIALAAELPRETQWIDEIWAPTRSAAQAIAAQTKIPVHVVPLPATVWAERIVKKSPQLRLAACADLSSSVSEALALIDAFAASDDDAVLEILVLAGPASDAERLRLHAARTGRTVRIVSATADEAAIGELLARSDAYVTLHREAFPLIEAQAARLAVPIVDRVQQARAGESKRVAVATIADCAAFVRERLLAITASKTGAAA